MNNKNKSEQWERGKEKRSEQIDSYWVGQKPIQVLSENQTNFKHRVIYSINDIISVPFQYVLPPGVQIHYILLKEFPVFTGKKNSSGWNFIVEGLTD